MKSHGLMRVAIEAAVGKGIEEIRTDPKRSIRKLVDLGNRFAYGRFSKHFLSMLQNMLGNEESAYYSLVQNIVRDVDARRISTFGMNIGYNSWTLGAKAIRKHEADLCFSIPWSILLEQKGGANAPFGYSRLEKLVAEGKELGIYAYLFYVGGADCPPDEILSLMRAHEDCAFTLFLPENADAQWICELEHMYHVLLMLPYGPQFHEQAKDLTGRRMLIGGYVQYDDADADEICSGKWAAAIEDVTCPFLFFIALPGCSAKKVARVHTYIIQLRQEQSVPAILVNVPVDILYVDRVISTQGCFFAITGEGEALLINDRQQTIRCDLEGRTLLEALQCAGK